MFHFDSIFSQNQIEVNIFAFGTYLLRKMLCAAQASRVGTFTAVNRSQIVVESFIDKWRIINNSKCKKYDWLIMQTMLETMPCTSNFNLNVTDYLIK